MARFGRVLSAMITPFTDQGALDLDEARRLARWLQDNGHDGLVIAGTTGEAPVLTDDERLSLFAAVIEAVTIPVIAGSGTNDTAHSVHLTKEATALGAAGILALCPYYNRPSQAGIEAHLRAMAECTPLPQMIYDIPVRTGRKVETDMGRFAQGIEQRLTATDDRHALALEKLGGEITRMRVAPRSGVQAFEVTIDDGTGTAVAVFTGRRHLAGVEHNRAVVLEGVARAERGRLMMLNPAYTLLPH